MNFEVCSVGDVLPSWKLTYSRRKGTFEDNLSFPRLGYVTSLEGWYGTYIVCYLNANLLCVFVGQFPLKHDWQRPKNRDLHLGVVKNLRLSLVFLSRMFVHGSTMAPVNTWGQWLVWPIGVFEFTPGHLGCGVSFLCDTARKGWVKLILQVWKKTEKHSGWTVGYKQF